jgi:hypothetical protein
MSTEELVADLGPGRYWIGDPYHIVNNPKEWDSICKQMESQQLKQFVIDKKTLIILKTDSGVNCLVKCCDEVVEIINSDSGFFGLTQISMYDSAPRQGICLVRYDNFSVSVSINGIMIHSKCLSSSRLRVSL